MTASLEGEGDGGGIGPRAPVEAPAPVAKPDPAGRWPAQEPWLAFLAATALASGFFWLARAVDFVRDNLHGFIALIFLYAPWAAGRLCGRPFDYRASGMHLHPVGPGLRTFALVVLVTLPLFACGFFLFYGTTCGPGAPAWADGWLQMFAPLCPRWRGFSGTPIALPPGFAGLALSQIVVIALPEELFFRGYLYQHFERRWPSVRRFLGAPIGMPMLVSSALFAIGHVLVDLDPRRLVVFFPGLVFAWMRARSGSIAAGTLYHAACNLISDILHESYFR